jgi:hypothetical protein
MPTHDDEWIARLAIGELPVRFADAVTRADWDALEALWAPDGVWEESEPFPNRYEGAREIRDRIAASMAAIGAYVQMPHGTVVTALGGGRATAVTTVQGLSVVGDADLVVHNFGVYADELVGAGGRWRFRRRFLQNVYATHGPGGGRVAISRADLAALGGSRR